MDTDAIISLVLGPLGAVAVMALLMAGMLTGRYVAPHRYLAAAEERSKRLENENTALNQALIRLTEQNGELKASVLLLEKQVEELRRQIQLLLNGRQESR